MWVETTASEIWGIPTVIGSRENSRLLALSRFVFWFCPNFQVFSTSRFPAPRRLPGLTHILLSLFTPAVPQRLVRAVVETAGCPWLVRWACQLLAGIPIRISGCLALFSGTRSSMGGVGLILLPRAAHPGRGSAAGKRSRRAHPVIPRGWEGQSSGRTEPPLWEAQSCNSRDLVPVCMLDSTSESAQRPPHSVPPHTLIEDTESPARQLSSLREMAMHSGGGRVEVTYEGAGLPDESIVATFLLYNMLQKHVTKQSHISL